MIVDDIVSAFPTADRLTVQKALEYYSEKRLNHIRGCVSEACRLAALFDENTEKAFTAALLHDIAKKFPEEKQLQLCDKYDIFDKVVLRESPAVIHAYTGAEIALDVFKVGSDIADAIRYHTCGRAGMTRLEKIIFLADVIEPSRKYQGVDELRSASNTDLDKAMLLSLRATVNHVRNNGNSVFYRSIEALDYFENL